MIFLKDNLNPPWGWKKGRLELQPPPHEKGSGRLIHDENDLYRTLYWILEKSRQEPSPIVVIRPNQSDFLDLHEFLEQNFKIVQRTDS